MNSAENRDLEIENDMEADQLTLPVSAPNATSPQGMQQERDKDKKYLKRLLNRSQMPPAMVVTQSLTIQSTKNAAEKSTIKAPPKETNLVKNLINRNGKVLGLAKKFDRNEKYLKSLDEKIRTRKEIELIRGLSSEDQ